jgi:hypothetical protein
MDPSYRQHQAFPRGGKGTDLNIPVRTDFQQFPKTADREDLLGG